MPLKVYFEDRKNSHLLFVVFAMLLLVIVANVQDKYIEPFYSFAQQVEKNPGFQDAYWTDKTIAAGNDSDKLKEKEVGPGEGIATLAVVLVNKAQSDISAIKGYLSLPDGFEAVERANTNSSNSNSIGVGLSNNSTLLSANADTVSNSFSNNSTNSSNLAVASYDSVVSPGNEFTLYFDIYITNDAKVGSYPSSLDLVYSKVLTAGDITVKDIPIAFRVPGKIILDVETKNQYLSPSKVNKVNIDIINKGSADANSAIITISNDDGNTEENLAPVTGTSTVDSIQQDNSTEITNSTTTTSSSNSKENAGQNTTNSSAITTVGTQKYDVGVIGPNQIVSINPTIYPATGAAGTLQNLDIQISYGNSLGNRETINYNMGLMINAEPKESNFNVYLQNNGDNNNINSNQNILNNKTSYDKMITAGSIEDLIFGIQKSTTESDIRDLVVSIQPSSESIKILGPSRWSFNEINDNVLPLNTTIFASGELIGKPVQLNFNLDYLLNGVAKSETLELGLYVDGRITIRAYDFEINVVGEEPNLVSNLLNEGNVDALFTTAEMVPPLHANMTTGADTGNNTISLVEEYPPIQYLGDLAENSPLPVNIPLKIPNNTRPGDYPVSIKISYKDNLRNDHQLIVNGTVNYLPQVNNTTNDTGLLFGFINPIILLILVPVIGIIAYLIVKRIRKMKKNQRIRLSKQGISESENDLDSILKDKD
ncbi:MAG TPA: hypothetical protein VD815_06515 [Candidatus Saccharimonadales bacterium]|nr:hypothetical protein [Candidatus Saccharimonadales bacterium]